MSDVKTQRVGFVIASEKNADNLSKRIKMSFKSDEVKKQIQEMLKQSKEVDAISHESIDKYLDICVIQQKDDNKFNRYKLFNIAYSHMKDNCVAFMFMSVDNMYPILLDACVIEQINGFSNNLWGSEKEDGHMFSRCKAEGVEMGFFKDKEDPKEFINIDPDKLELECEDHKEDGLNTLEYDTIKKKKDGQTLIMVVSL